MLSEEEKQQILEFVTMHLATQGIAARESSDYQCVYMTVDGNRCAIGCMMSEEQCIKYDSAPEFYNIGGVLISDNVNGWTLDDAAFLMHLQRCHDTAEKSKCYIEAVDLRLRALARYWDLRFSEELL